MNYRKVLTLTVSQWLEYKEIHLTDSARAKFAAEVAKEYRSRYSTVPRRITTKSYNTGRYTNKAYGYLETEFEVLEWCLSSYQLAQESIESISLSC